MSKIEDGGPAFPGGAVRKTRPAHDPGADFRVTDITEPRQSGMTLRQYAAIKLRVPSSGTDWLDEMIRESLHNEAAVDVLKASLSKKGPIAVLDFDWMVGLAGKMTDAMLKARKAE